MNSCIIKAILKLILNQKCIYSSFLRSKFILEFIYTVNTKWFKHKTSLFMFTDEDVIEWRSPRNKIYLWTY